MKPLILIFYIERKSSRDLKLWLPFFIWLIAVLLVILLSPLVLVAALILWPAGKGKLTICLIPLLFRIIGCTSGLNSDIETKDSTFI